jgi:co-chaperonin GroES (HSP10)
MYQVLFDNLLVEEESQGTILVAGEKQIKGKVVSTGDGGKFPMKFVEGDVVYFPQFEAIKFKNYWVVSQQYIIAKE